MKFSEKIKAIRRGLYWMTQRFSLNQTEFGYWGNKVNVGYPCSLNYPRNIYLYDDVNIGSNSMISAIHSKFIMKEHSGAADGFMVRTGNHMIVLGKNHHEVTDEYKLKSGHLGDYDKDVIVEEDVWIGCNVTLLSGSIVGRGSTVGAGSVVVKSIPPYCIAAGVPCKFIKFRWTIDEILEHEKILYPEEKRLTREQLETYFAKYKK